MLLQRGYFMHALNLLYIHDAHFAYSHICTQPIELLISKFTIFAAIHILCKKCAPVAPYFQFLSANLIYSMRKGGKKTNENRGGAVTAAATTTDLNAKE